jgi:hydroxymethylglutaryl-CoA synthase
MKTSILGYGMYVPKLRVKADEISAAWGGGSKKIMEKAVTNFDEDVITMAVEAAQSALSHAKVSGKSLGAIYLGTDSSPYIEQGATSLLAEVIDAPPDVFLADLNGSPRASTAALIACIDGIESGRYETGLVIGADDRPARPGSTMEETFGAGAVALILGRKNGLAEVESLVSYSQFFVDRWRASDDSFVRDFDPRFTIQYGYLDHSAKAVELICERTKRSIEDFDHIVFQQSDLRGSRKLGSIIKAPREKMSEGSIFLSFGDLGAASIFMGLASVFANARKDHRILAISYGAGVSDAISLVMRENEHPEPSPSFHEFSEQKVYISYIDYLKLREILTTGEEPIPLAVPPTSPAFMRGRQELLHLEGGKCINCGYINYPPSIRTICVRCGNSDFEKVKLSKKGILHTHCVNYYMPPGFEVPLANILIDLESGGRFMGMGTEVHPEELKVGMPMKLVLRRITKERGVSVYGYKIKPI